MYQRSILRTFQYNEREDLMTQFGKTEYSMKTITLLDSRTNKLESIYTTR